MIEIIYKDKTTENHTETTIKTPKNIRQIGNNSSTNKIYIEDYVMTYLKRYPKDTEQTKYGVLLGTMKTGNGFTYTFVNGVVEAPVTKDEINFDDTIWTELYENIRQYFENLEIVGWFVSIPYKVRDDIMNIQKIHLDNFRGNKQICFINDRSQSEDGFFVYENGRMNKQPGYYIYYDRNENMQKYFIDKHIDEEAVPKEEVRQSEGSFRAIMNEQAQSTPKINSQLIKAGAMVAMVAVLVTAISSFNNYGDIKNINGAINKLASAILDDPEEETTDGTVIEVVGGNVEPTTKKPETSTENTEKVTTKKEESTTKKESESAETEPNKGAAIDETSYYTVRKGETLFEICMKVYNDANMLEKLRTVNKLDKDYTITQGQKIILP